MNNEVIIILGFIPHTKQALLDFFINCRQTISELDETFTFLRSEYLIQEGLVLYYNKHSNKNNTIIIRSKIIKSSNIGAKNEEKKM